MPLPKPIVVCLAMLLLAVGMSHAQSDRLKFRHLTVDNGLPQNSVFSVVMDKYGFMWFATWGGAVRYDGYRFQVYRANENDTLALPDNRVSYVLADSANNIWVQSGDFRYLYKYSYQGDNFVRIPYDVVPLGVRAMITRREGGTSPSAANGRSEWRSEKNELLQVDLRTGARLVYVPDRTKPFALSDNIINSIYLDDNDNIWIGTQNGGVNYACLTPKPFAVEHMQGDNEGLVDNVVRAIAKDRQGRIWVGSENKGITIIDAALGRKTYHHVDAPMLKKARVRFLYGDKRGDMWIGTKTGLVRYDAASDTFTDCSAGICDPNVFAVLEDHRGDLWVGTFRGLARFDRHAMRFDCLDEALTNGVQIRAIIESRDHSLWVAAEDGGITKLERTTGPDGKATFNPVHFSHHEGNEHTPINNRVYSLAEDGDGMIWMATNSGLSWLNPTDRTFKHFTIKDGLPDDVTMGVLYDGKSSVWVSHKKGLTRISTTTFELQSFNVYDGLQGNEFNQNTCFRDSATGELFFGGTNGLNAFFPDSIQINRVKPRPVFTRLNVMNQEVRPGEEVNGRVVLPQSLLCTDEVTLTWHDKTVGVEFAALHFANPRGNKYRYKLDGYDKHWHQTDASMRTAMYSQLPAGRYVLKVLAANSDGVWSDAPAMLRIRVLPPWWLTWWAMAIYVLAALALAWIIFRYVASRVELRQKEALHRAKLRFFTDVSHEFRTPLTLIVDPLEKLMGENLDQPTVKHLYRMMHRNAKQLLLLINQLLDFRKLESGHLTLCLQSADVVAFTRGVAASFETRAAERHLRFETNSSVGALLMAFDDTKLHMVLNNLLSNAFKFTPDHGSISVSIQQQGNEVAIRVSDTGMGIAKEEHAKVFELFYQSAQNRSAHEGSGIGLALTNELVRLHGGQLLLESEAGKGACFTVRLPLRNADALTAQPQVNAAPLGPDGGEPVSTLLAAKPLAEAPLLLVVDDNADIRAYIEMNFGMLYRVVTATNGDEGFRRAIETIPDVVVSDVMMPGTDGLTLCRMLKTDERTSHIPVLLLTARQSNESIAEGYETGADAYVTKPFSTVVLQAQIRNLLEQRQRLRELFSRGTPIELKKIAINATDGAFLNKVTHLVDENMGDENFNIDALADTLGMSRSQFYRKIKALTNQSLYEFVTALRMNKALEYLLSGECNITETAYRVGYGIPNNFTRAFNKHFGMSPTAYVDSLKR